MLNRIITVHSKDGLHIRPAAKLVRLVRKYDATVELFANDRAAKGTSMLQIMRLGVTWGSQVELQVSGTEKEVAFKAISEFLMNSREL